MTRPIIKICGLKTEDAIEAASLAGADMLGFVFFPPSPRHLAPARARELARAAKGGVRKVALTVDAQDQALEEIIAALGPDLIQLHGRETPERAAEIRRKFGRPVIKAIGVAGAQDVARARAYEGVVDFLLFDAKPDPSATRPGGNGRAFDWSLLRDARVKVPWLLSGGLTPDTVARALSESGAQGVDASSGVESSPGVKDLELIRRFIAAALGGEPA